MLTDILSAADRGVRRLELGRGRAGEALAPPALGCFAVAAAVVLLLCLVRARQQVGCWRGSETLFRHAIAVTKDNWLAHNNLGLALYQKGQIDEAIRQYQEAVRIKPGLLNAHYNLGVAFDLKGQKDEAIRQFQEAIAVKPDNAAARKHLGLALYQKGQIDEAIRQYQEVID